MGFGDVATPSSGGASSGDGGVGLGSDRLSLGVAARLSRYLQVLTQARKMGKETISSQELSEYTHVNSTQIRRDLSGFGKFGKRGVGYNVDSLVSQIRKILRTSGQHNIALFGAGHLGKAIASSDIFADHGFRVVAIFDQDPAKLGERVGPATVRHPDDLKAVVEEEDIVVEEGDMVCVHTGFAKQLLEAGDEPDIGALMMSTPALEGRDPELQAWIAKTGIATLSADNFAVEAVPSAAAAKPCASLPLHELCLFKLGVHLGELWNLSELAGWLRANGRSRFLLTAPPLRIPGAVGSPANGLATV